jgi:putative FmdB family regulatory protein
MPLYVYRATSPERCCASCRRDFEVLQSLRDAKLTACPECGAPVARQFTTCNAAFPQGAAALRNIGMARLEKRSDGSYENVSAQEGHQRVGSLDSFAKDLSTGPKPVISD